MIKAAQNCPILSVFTLAFITADFFKMLKAISLTRQHRPDVILLPGRYLFLRVKNVEQKP